MSNHESCENWGDDFCNHPHLCAPTNQPTDEAAVEQVDRDASASLFAKMGGSLTGCDLIRAGGADKTPAVKAFAVHRRDEIQSLRAQLTAATQRAEQMEAEEPCPCCEGKPMGSGEFCIAGCREGVVFTTTAHVLRNVLPWLRSADRRAEQAERMLAEAVAALQPFAECVEQISSDESDEEWAKFRLLIKDYRRAAGVCSTASDDDDSACTDCEGTGITIQTERVCSCDAGGTIRSAASGEQGA